MVWVAPAASLFLWDSLHLGKVLGYDNLDTYLFKDKCDDVWPECTSPDTNICPPCGQYSPDTLGETAPFYLSTSSCYSPTPVYRLFGPMGSGSKLNTSESVMGELLKIEQLMDFDYRAILTMEQQKRDAGVRLSTPKAKKEVKQITKMQKPYYKEMDKLRHQRNQFIKDAHDKRGSMDQSQLGQLSKVYGHPGVKYNLYGNLTVGIYYVPGTEYQIPASNETPAFNETSENGLWSTIGTSSTFITSTTAEAEIQTQVVYYTSTEDHTETASYTTKSAYINTAAPTGTANDTDSVADSDTETIPTPSARLERRKHKKHTELVPFDQASSRLNNLVPMATTVNAVTATAAVHSTKTPSATAVTKLCRGPCE